MRVSTIGSGAPEIAVVGGIHGDEHCGVAAIEALRARPSLFDDPAKCLIANERALEANERYVDTDLNRGFPGQPDGGLTRKYWSPRS